MKFIETARFFFFLFTIACITSLYSCGGPDDKETQTKITTELQKDPTFKNINAVVKDGVVTLQGSCQTGNCDSLAESKVKDIDGVKRIENQIQKSEATDLTLRTSVQSVVSKYEGVQADVAGGVVVLRGSIEKKQIQPLMNELQALKPKKLDNQLAIK